MYRFVVFYIGIVCPIIEQAVQVFLYQSINGSLIRS